ncbi:unnamed protein product [Microthlaspi erraticum]|uniref:INO80 complex subunit B-like conserved region domain-containing protein n=1 Tax=Microthlaspi erraticum TaxID=1685480 RepID=A0A6D2HV44_9BRAS|nr:unnamed protein product [Microthlaspi erraticum]
MEASEASASTLAGFMERRRRSSLIRRPRDVKGSLHSFTFLQPSTQQPNPSYRKANGPASENTLKLKLKLGGGVTRTIQTNSEAKVKGNVPDQRHVQKTMYLGEIRVSPSETVNGGSVCEKSKRGLKKRLLDPEQDSDDDGDEEIRYLEKLKSKRVNRDYHEGKESRKLHSNGHNMEEDMRDKYAVTQRKKPVDSLTSGTTPRNGPLEFPDGLPCPSSKRQKQKLSEVEQQSKKAEVAQRRRMLSEKAAQEAEAEAIRKILGQDSGRKKKEEKIKKQQEERAQERAERSSTLAANTVRLVIGPSGTTLTFSEDIGLPDIFKPITYSYPPPREKCVGPNCEKAYKYRDSKSKLPLCSLSCYNAIQEKMQQSPIHC